MNQESGLRLMKHSIKAHDFIEIVNLSGEAKNLGSLFVKEFALWRFICDEAVPSEAIMERIKQDFLNGQSVIVEMQKERRNGSYEQI